MATTKVTADVIEDSAITTAKIAAGALTADATGRAKMADGFITAAKLGDASVTAAKVGAVGGTVQAVYTQTGAVATGTTTIPGDDTIPQNTEGTEFMTQAITPTNASNKLRITVTAFLASSAAGHMTVALFQDSTANALASGTVYIETTNALRMVTFTHEMVAGTTSATTFKVRAGNNNAATNTFNGTSGARLFGGVMASSIRVEEIKV